MKIHCITSLIIASSLIIGCANSDLSAPKPVHKTIGSVQALGGTPVKSQASHPITPKISVREILITQGKTTKREIISLLGQPNNGMLNEQFSYRPSNNYVIKLTYTDNDKIRYQYIIGSDSATNYLTIFFENAIVTDIHVF